MKHSDVEELARKAGFLVVTLEPGAGYDPIRMIQPVSSTNVAVELSKFAALVLEKAAENHDDAAKEWQRMAQGCNSGMYDDKAMAAQQLADDLRQMSAALQSGDSSGGVK